MKQMFKALLCLALAASSLTAQNAQDTQASSAGLPPLIDRELIFGNPEISGAQLSPDGKYLAFQKPWKATRNIYVKGVDEPFIAARLLTAEPKRPIAAYFWSRDSRYILYAKDNDGDENYNVYAVDPGAKPPAGADAPVSRDLTGLKGVRVQIVAVPKNDPDTIYIGLNDRDKAWHDLYRLRLSTGEKTLVRKNTERITRWEFDLQGNLRLTSRSAENGDTEILRVDSDKLTKIYSCNVFESCDTIRFQKDGKRAYLETNKGADMHLSALVLFDPETGKTETWNPIRSTKWTSASPSSRRPQTSWRSPCTRTIACAAISKTKASKPISNGSAESFPERNSHESRPRWTSRCGW